MADALRQRGLDGIANAWSAFYLHGWSYYLSDHRDGAAAREAIRAASECLRSAGTWASEQDVG